MGTCNFLNLLYLNSKRIMSENENEIIKNALLLIKKNILDPIALL
jgi:hypothetical protein